MILILLIVFILMFVFKLKILKFEKINNKGFTLIEVLAVIVILGIIVSIAIVNINASLERQKCTMLDDRGVLIKSAAQFYISSNRGDISKNLSDKLKNQCKVSTNTLKPEYITAEDLKDNDKNTFSGYVIYDITNANTDGETYTFCFADLDSGDGIEYNEECGLNNKKWLS